MGIVNVTPDSFSDGGQYHATEAAVAHALDLINQGADILDVGGESTRPNATPVSLQEELHRVIPVIESLAKQIADDFFKRFAAALEVPALAPDPEVQIAAARTAKPAPNKVAGVPSIAWIGALIVVIVILLALFGVKP